MIKIKSITLLAALVPTSFAFGAAISSVASGEWSEQGIWTAAFASSGDSAYIGSHDINLTAGNVSVNRVWIGNGENTVGSLSVGGGLEDVTITVTNAAAGVTEDIGRSAGSTATLNILERGNFRATGTVNLGFSSGSTGVVDVFGGSFGATALNIGAYNNANSSGSGVFRISGGSAFVDGTTIVGNNCSGTGVLDISGGSFSTGSIHLGSNSTANLTISNATLTINGGVKNLLIANTGTGDATVTLRNGGHLVLPSEAGTSYLGASNGLSSVSLTVDSTSSLRTAGKLSWRRGYDINFITGVDESFLGLSAQYIIIDGNAEEAPRAIVDMAAFSSPLLGTLDIVLLTVDHKPSNADALVGVIKNARSDIINLTDMPPVFSWRKEFNGGKWQYVLTLKSARTDLLRVLTFNILASNPAWEANAYRGEWTERKPGILEIMRGGNYDFIGTQETSINPNPELDQAAQLSEEMAVSGYGSLGAPCDGYENLPKFTLTNMLFYKKDCWEMDTVEQGHFWLSAKPDIPGSTDWFGSRRCVTWALFHETVNGHRTGRKVYFYNTHLNSTYDEARLLSAFLIMERINQRTHQDAAVFLTGDFNCTEDSGPVGYIKGQSISYGGSLRVPPFAMKDAWRQMNPSETRPRPDVDMIFYTGSIQAATSRVIESLPDGVRSSDHFPVEAVLRWTSLDSRRNGEWTASGTWNRAASVADDNARIGKHAITLTSGNVTVKQLWVGNGSNVNGSLSIGDGTAGKTASLTVTTTTQTVGQESDIGRSTHSNATVNVYPRGTLDFTGRVILGYSGGSTGVINIEGGNFSAGAVGIGGNGNALLGGGGSGVFKVSGGSATVSDVIIIGNNSSGNASLNVAGGRLSTGNLSVGNRSQGFATVSGGQLISLGETVVGTGAGGAGIVHVSGGSFSSAALLVGNNSNSLFKLDGGNVNIGTATIGNNGSGTGTLSINGGNFSAKSLSIGTNGSTGFVNISGATLTITGGASCLTLANTGNGSGSLTLREGGHLILSSENGSAWFGSNAGTSTMSLTLDSTSSVKVVGSIVWRRGTSANFLTGVGASFQGITAKDITVTGSGAFPRIIVDMAGFNTQFSGTRDIVLLRVDEKTDGADALVGEYKNVNGNLIDIVRYPPSFVWKQNESSGQWRFVLTFRASLVQSASTSPGYTSGDEFLRYALSNDSNARSEQDYLSRVGLGKNNKLGITFTPLRDGVRYDVQQSTDLLTWTTIETIQGNSSKTDSVTIESDTSTSTEAKLFLRLKVSR